VREIIHAKVSAKELQDYVNLGDTPIVFKGGAERAIVTEIEITNPAGDNFSKLDLKNVTIQIQVPVSIDASAANFTIIASKAAITRTGTAQLALKNGIKFLTGSRVDTDAVNENGATVPEVVTSVDEITDKIAQGDDVTFDGTLTAAQLAGLSGSGTLYVTGAVKLENSNTIPAAAKVAVAGELVVTGTVNLGGNTGLDLSAATLTTGSATTSVTLPASASLNAINASGDLTLAGSGSVTVTGAATFGGETTISTAVTFKGETTFNDETDFNANVTFEKTAVINDTASVEASSTLAIAATGSISVAGELTAAASSVVNVAAGGKIEVAGTFTIASGASGDLNGTISIKSGGTSYDLKASGGSLWGGGDSDGKYVFEPGAKAYVGGDDDDDDLVIGGSGDTTARLQLTSGTFSNNASGYVLDGNATINKTFFLTGGTPCTIKAGRTLTIGANRNSPQVVLGLVVDTGKPGLLGENNATIVVNSWIDIWATDMTCPTDISNQPHNFYSASSTKEAVNSLGGIYKWDATLGSSAGGWKAQ
jgi:hypothetical protein